MTEDAVSGEPERWEGKNKFHFNKSGSVPEDPEELADTQADTKVILIVLTCAVLMMIHLASGWTFDF